MSQAKAGNKEFFGFLGRALVNGFRESGDIGQAVARAAADVASAAAMSAENEAGFTDDGGEDMKAASILTDGQPCPEKGEPEPLT